MLDELRRPRVLFGSTECSTCRMQMEDGGGKRTLHPAQYLALAYGLMPELRPPAARTDSRSGAVDDAATSACSPAPGTWPAPIASPSNCRPGATVADLRRRLAARLPAPGRPAANAAPWPWTTSSPTTIAPLTDGAEVALLPPVSGG